MANVPGNVASSSQPTIGGAVASAQAADAATRATGGSLQQSPQQQASPARREPTTFTTAPASSEPAGSRVVQRLLEQNATVYGPGLARIPLPPRPEGAPRATPRKPAGPMVAPRDLAGGRSPLASSSLYDARASTGALGAPPSAAAETGVLADAQEGAWRMPSRHGLVAYTTNERGDRVYLTQERWLHIRDNHMDPAPQPRGKRTTTYWPTRHAVDGPTMTDQQVIGVIVDAARRGTLRTEVRDTRMAEYDLPRAQREAYGVSEAKVSMAPDGLVLSAYPGAGDRVLAVYELSQGDQAELARVEARATNAAADARDQRMFRTNIAPTSFG